MTLRMPGLAGALGVLALAILIGLALSVPLLGTSERYGGPVGGEWWLPLFTSTSVGLGWVAARLSPPATALAISALAPPLAIVTLIGVKVVRWPMLPAVGAGFELGLPLYAGLGVVAMLVTRASRLPVLPWPIRWYVTFGLLSLGGIGAAVAILQLARFVGT